MSLLAVTGPFAEAALALAVIAAGVAIVGRSRTGAVAMILAGGVAVVLLFSVASESEQLQGLRGRPAGLMAAAVVGFVGLVALAALFLRRPGLFPIVALAVAALRLPIGIAGETANLLLPLYGVVAARVLSYAVEQFRGAGKPTEVRDADGGVFAGRGLRWALAGFVVLYGVQSMYSVDFAEARKEVVFFLVPFSLLFRLVVDTPWSLSLLRRAGAVVVLEALVFAAVGYREFFTGRLIWSPGAVDVSAFSTYLRPSSLFFDPSVFGRFLVMAILISTAVAIGRTIGRRAGVLVGVSVVFLWGALVITFSQSSYVALLGGVVVLAAVRWGVRRTAAVAGTFAVVAVVVAALFGGSLNIETDRFGSADRTTQGRLQLVSGGMELFGGRPVFGWGSGSFAARFQEEKKAGHRDALVASHTTPVTVLVEQGAVGFVAYVALIVLAFGTLFRFIRPRPGSAIEPEIRVARSVVAAIFAAVWIHTLVYADFLEDPFVWIVLALGIALAPAIRSRTGSPDGSSKAPRFGV